MGIRQLFGLFADTLNTAAQLRKEAEHLHQKFDSASGTAKHQIQKRLHEVMQQMEKLRK